MSFCEDDEMTPFENAVIAEATGRGWPAPDSLQNVWTCKRCGWINYPWMNVCLQGCEPIDGSENETTGDV